MPSPLPPEEAAGPIVTTLPQLVPLERTLRELSPEEAAHRRELERLQKEHDLREAAAVGEHKRQDRRLGVTIAVGATAVFLLVAVLFASFHPDPEIRKAAFQVILTLFVSLMAFLAGKGTAKEG